MVKFNKRHRSDEGYNQSLKESCETIHSQDSLYIFYVISIIQNGRFFPNGQFLNEKIAIFNEYV